MATTHRVLLEKITQAFAVPLGVIDMATGSLCSLNEAAKSLLIPTPPKQINDFFNELSLSSTDLLSQIEHKLNKEKAFEKEGVWESLEGKSKRLIIKILPITEISKEFLVVQILEAEQNGEVDKELQGEIQKFEALFNAASMGNLVTNVTVNKNRNAQFCSIDLFRQRINDQNNCN